MIGFPGICSIAEEITSGSVESITNGASTSKLIFFTSCNMNSFSSALSVVATQTSRQCAPSSTWDLAKSTSPSKSSFKTSCLALREPCVFTRSPIIKGGGTCFSSTAFKAELTLAFNVIYYCDFSKYLTLIGLSFFINYFPESSYVLRTCSTASSNYSNFSIF